jgi:hypothetical protein
LAITSQPASVTNAAGATATFVAAAAGLKPLEYRWQHDGLPLADLGRISGAASTNLSVAQLLPGDAGDYQLVVTNPVGSVTSLVATLTVLPPAIVAVPDTNLEACLRSWLHKPSGPLTPTDLATLNFFCASDRGITNVAGLEWATNLTGLALAHNAITDLSPLSSLHALVQLDAGNNALTNLTPLASLRGLTNLNLGGNQIASAAPLCGLTNLTSLWLDRNPLGSVAPLSNLTTLRTLVLFQTGVADLAPLIPIRGLSHLDVRGNPLTNAATVLTQITNLSTLYLGDSCTTSLSFLLPLARLESLDLDHNAVRDFSALAALPALKHLDLGHNPLTNLSQFNGLTNLQSLYFAGNAVSNLLVLAPLTRLSTLELADNAIADLTPLAASTQLQNLGLSRNPLTNLAPLNALTNPKTLNALTNLKTLRLDGIPLTNASYLAAMPALAAVSLRSTRLASLAPLASLTNLVALYAHENWLTDISPLTGLTALHRVDLTGNLLDVTSNAPPQTVAALLQARGTAVDLLPQNQPPVVFLPGSWAIATNRTSSLVLQVADDLTPPEQLRLTASATDPGLLPSVSIAPGLQADHPMLVVTPAPDRTGSAAILLTVTDDAGLTANVMLTISVVAPVPVPVPDPSLAQFISFEVGTTGTTFDSLGLASLTLLNAWDGRVSDLTGLERATNLVELYVSGTNLLNLAPLAALQKLERLTLISDALVDASPLAGLTNLTTLYLEAPSLTNLDFLHDLRRLQYLTLLTPQAQGGSSLSTLTNLVTLQLSANLNNNLAFLAPLGQLRVLSLADCRLSSLNTFTAPAALEVLELEHNSLSDLAPLTNNWFALSYLDVRFNLLDTDYHIPLQILRARVATVLDDPQRTAPFLACPALWIGAAGAPTYIRFKASDNGASRWEQLALIVQPSIPALGGTNLALAPDGDPALPDDWILTVFTPAGQSGLSTLTVLATNAVGFATTGVVQFAIAPPADLNSVLPEATNLAWQTGGDAPWFAESFETHDGLAAAQSGSIGNYQESWVETVVTGPGGISFWWKVSSETNYDWLELRRNGELRARISGDTGWQQVQVSLPPGPQTLRWRYVKDNNNGVGMDAGWLDQVRVKIPADITLTVPNATYDGLPKPASAASSPPGLAVNLSYNRSNAPPVAAGSYAVVATINDTNYGGFASNVLFIAKAPLTASAVNLSRPEGAANPTFPFSYTGFVNGEGTNALAALPTASTPADASSPAGTYPILVAGGAATNYALNLVPGILTVTQTNLAFVILSLTDPGTTNALLTWSAISNKTYRAEAHSGLGGPWAAVGPDVTATGNTASVYDRSGLSGPRYYRVVLLPDPAFAAPRILSLTTAGGTGRLITWTTISNRIYQLQSAASLGGPWFTLPPNITASGSTASAVDPTLPSTQCYYRVMLVP